MLKKKAWEEDQPNSLSLSLFQEIEILNWSHANGRKQTTTAKHLIEKYPWLRFGQPKLSEWLKDQEKEMRRNQDAGLGVHYKQKASTKNPQVTRALETWVTQADHAGKVSNGSIICTMW